MACRSAASAITALAASRIGCDRAVVALQPEHGRGRREQAREVQDVAHGGAAEGVDRLRVVPDHRDAAPVRLEALQDRGLERVRVLVLVDQHVVEPPARVGRDLGHAQHPLPPQQQVVVVEHALALLRRHVGREQAPEVVVPLGAPREGVGQHRGERAGGVDRGRVGGEAGGLPREAAVGPGQAQPVPDQVEQVGRVAPVQDGEGRVEPDRGRVEAQQPGADAVEGAGPLQVERGVGAERAAAESGRRGGPSPRPRGG